MKLFKYFLLIFVFLLISVPYSVAKVLKAGVSFVPEGFYGSWRVVSQRVETDSPVTFKEKGLDLWNLSQENDVITLSNPFSGASAQIQVSRADKNSVVFSKNGKYDNKILIDTVSITINGESFTGVDELKLDTVSDVDGKIIKSERAKYSIKGEKIAGQSVLGK